MRTRCSRVAVYLVLTVAAREADVRAQGAPDVVWEGRSHSGYVGAVAFSPDGQILATGDGNAPEYDPDTGQLIFPGEGTVRVWAATDGTLLRSRTEDVTAVGAIAISPDGQRLASGATLKLWSFPDLDSFIELTDYPSHLIASVAFSPDGRFLAAGMPGDEDAVKIYTADGTFLRRLPLANWVSAVAFSPDSRFLAVAASNNVQIYRTSDWQFERVIYGVDFYWAASLAFSVNNELLASSSAAWGGTTKLWRLSDGQLIREFEGGGHSVFSADGQILLVSSPPIRFYQVSDGVLLKQFDEPGGFINSIAFSPDDSVFAFTQPTAMEQGSSGKVLVARNPLITR
jgi:WD40 repeat protein